MEGHTLLPPEGMPVCAVEKGYKRGVACEMGACGKEKYRRERWRVQRRQRACAKCNGV